jgi:hypothetical protein
MTLYLVAVTLQIVVDASDEADARAGARSWVANANRAAFDAIDVRVEPVAQAPDAPPSVTLSNAWPITPTNGGRLSR